jgi:Ca2+-binding RTX toxin-like protein
MSRYMENLENRTLFAAAPPVATATLVGANLSVMGTKKVDDIHVRLSADLANVEVAHNGTVVASHAVGAVSMVTIDAGKGHDNVHIDANVMVNAHLTGGVGNDTLVGSVLLNVLVGGNGRDNLTGGPLNDVLQGDNGADILVGGEGNDNLSGGNGPDSMDAGAGADILVGGKGRDALTGGEGADNFAGNDKLWEFRDLNGIEDTYTININPWDLIDDIFPW